MPDKTCKLKLPALTLLAAVATTPVLAQETRWFRVELLVFANESTEQPAGAAIAEQWEATPKLAYPLASRFLVDTARVAENAAEFEGHSLVDEYGRQIITSITEGSMPHTTGAIDASITGEAPASAETPQPLVPVPPTPVYQEGTPGATAPAARQAAIAKPLLLPRPFVVLPGDYRELRGKAALMERGGRYTVLFHQTWVQPVGPEKLSLPIVLDRSGDTREWPRLQGTINLSLSRYLHVQTNLWLNTSGEYLPGTWQMPVPPLGPPSLIVEQQELVDIASAVGTISGSSQPDPEVATDVLEVNSSGADIAGQSQARSEAGVLTEAMGDGSVAPYTNGPTTGLEGEESLDVDAPIYPYRHAVLLEQTRRMRSNEIHYIDHPLMGVVVKFTPISADELDAIAAQQ